MANNLKTRITNAFAAMGKQEKVILTLTVEAIDHAEKYSNAPDMLRHLLTACHNERDHADLLTIITAYAPFVLNAEKLLTVSKAKTKQPDAYKVDQAAIANAKSFRSLAKELRGEKDKPKAGFDLVRELEKLIRRAEKECADASQLAALKAATETLLPQIIEAEAAANVTQLKTA